MPLHFPIGALPRAPSVSSQVVPFPLFELQALWVARVLAGSQQLPPRAAMRAAAAAFYAALKAQGVPERHTHMMGSPAQVTGAGGGLQVGLAGKGKGGLATC